MSAVVVSVKDFTKAYSGHVAVDGIGFEVVQGEILAILGPNGAGKTSTLECVEGVRRPDGGRISVLGLDPIKDARKLIRRVGVQLQAQGLPPAMTVREALGFFARYRGIAPDTAIALRLGLGVKMDSQIGELSTGQQRRLALTLAVQHHPELIVLDEPTAGLDVETRDELHSLMVELRAGGSTILLATHDMAEAEKLADRAVVLVGGKIAARGSPRELTAAGEGRTRIVVSTRGGRLVKAKPGFRGTAASLDLIPPAVEGEYATYLCSRPGEVLRQMLAWIEGEGDEIVDLRVERPSLEERFLEIVGRRN